MPIAKEIPITMIISGMKSVTIGADVEPIALMNSTDDGRVKSVPKIIH